MLETSPVMFLVRVLAPLVVLAALVGAQDRTTFHGRVVDAGGHPVAGADVSHFWVADFPYSPVQTDAAGRFTVELDADGSHLKTGSVVYMVQDAKRERGAICRFVRGAGRQQEVVLTPLVEVRGRFECPELDYPIPWTNVQIMVWPYGGRIGAFDSDDSRFRLLLPKGLYDLEMYGTDVKQRHKKCFLNGRDRVVDLGTIRLAPTNLALLYGQKAPPIRIKETRGCAPEVQFSDFAGKFVLIEFFAFW